MASGSRATAKSILRFFENFLALCFEKTSAKCKYFSGVEVFLKRSKVKSKILLQIFS